MREAEKAGRIKFHTLSDFYHVINKLVRPGHHVLIDVEIVNNMMIGYDVTFKGKSEQLILFLCYQNVTLGSNGVTWVATHPYMVMI